MSESLEAFKKTLESCQKGLELWNAQKTANDAVIQYNNEQNQFYATVTYPMYQTQLNEYNQKMNNYQSCLINTKNALRNERRHWNNCVVWNETSAGRHNDWCQNDTGMEWHVGQDGAGCAWGWGKGLCGYSDGQVDRIANERCGTGYFVKPDVPPQPPLKEQNKTPFTLNCCANFTQVVGSTLEDTTINQENQCMANLQEKVKQAEIQATSTAPPKVVQTTSPPASTQKKQTETKSSTTEKEQDNMNMYIIIFIIISCLICMSLSSSLLYTYM